MLRGKWQKLRNFNTLECTVFFDLDNHCGFKYSSVSKSIEYDSKLKGGKQE